MKITPELHASYVNHALTMNEQEEEIRAKILPEIPDTIIDSHTHVFVPGSLDVTEIPIHIQDHMMSTFPGFTLEQSLASDQLLFQGKQISKARFAHIFPNINKKIVNSFVGGTLPKQGDIPVLFGISDSKEDIDYTIASIESGIFKAIKMYYLATEPPKYGFLEYFPEAVLESAEKNEHPVIVHLPHSLYRSSDEVMDVAQRHPDLKIILAHVGVANIDKPELDDRLAAFAKAPNIFVDTALVDESNVVLKALQHLGPKRVLYGSDEPLNLMRTITYYNPELQAGRVLTDYPYHWANNEEQIKYRHLAKQPFVHNHWRQMQALIGAIANISDNPGERQANSDLIFGDNARSLFV